MERTFTASQLLRELSNKAGQDVSQAVIKKWYYEFLKDYISPQNPHERLIFTEKDVMYFQLVALLRSLWVPLKEVKIIIHNTHTGNEKLEIKNFLDNKMNKLLSGYNAILSNLL